jgi:DNA polymerase-3 subunit alpha
LSAATAPEFVHLRTRSHYSLLAAPIRIPELVLASTQDGQRALALTDNGNLFGAVEFYKACLAQQQKPILGMVTYVATRSRLEPTSAENPTSDLTLLAADNAGFDNLKRLSSLAWKEGFHYRPRVDRELLQAHRSGLIVLSGSIQGPIGRLLGLGLPAEALRAAGELAELLGKEQFFLELGAGASEAQQRVNEGLQAIARRLDLRVVATNDVYYLHPDDWIAQDILTCIQSQTTLKDNNRLRLPSRDLWLMTRRELGERFAACPAALAATIEIAERCHVQLEFGKYHLPVFGSERQEPLEQLFESSCRAGARERYGEPSAAVRERLEHEMRTIEKLGFVSYFLIVSDFIRYAREVGVPVGPGRGSAAGSIVAYVLRITDVDPLRYQLIFERFLNDQRVTMPDIDIDFCGERRDEIIDYVRAKYGVDNVCQIITFGTLASRGVLRDVGRVLELELADVDTICKKVPQGPGASLKKALETDQDLIALRAAAEQNRRLFDLGCKLEGLARHSSIHAAGVVIADRPLIDYVPMCRSADAFVTQWQMNHLEDVGLLKMDFLGLKTLTILNEACRLIGAGDHEPPNLDCLPLEDPPTYALMTRGETLGVFQLESDGMRDLLGKLKPDKFKDLIAVLALYRPGPIGSGMVDMFVRRKHGQEPVEYAHPDLRPILEETYGVIVYQEQVMRIANAIAGFPLSMADELRKAMGKKKPEVMAKFKDQFVEGATRLGHQARFARELFETIEYFAGYGFNKSHSTAYALLTYRTAWIKTHHPLEFYAANLTVESGDSDKVKELIDDARRRRVSVLPPSVNASERRFVVTGGAVRFGLGAVKGVGSRTADAIAQERAAQGPYASLDELCERLDPTLLNKAALEALTCAGAFDGLEASRGRVFANLASSMKTAAAAREDRRRGQRLLFAGGGDAGTRQATTVAEDWTRAELLSREKQALGFYLSGHPFEKRGSLYARLAGHDSRTLRGLAPGTEVRLAGMVAALRVMQIKSGRNAGQKMARFHVEDLHGVVPVTCFARSYQEVKDRLVEDAIVFVRGRVDGASEELTLLLDELEAAPQVVEAEIAELVLRLDVSRLREHDVDEILALVARHPGRHRLQLLVHEQESSHRARAGTGASVAISEELLDGLAELLGDENLSFTRAPAPPRRERERWRRGAAAAGEA